MEERGYNASAWCLFMHAYQHFSCLLLCFMLARCLEWEGTVFIGFSRLMPSFPGVCRHRSSNRCWAYGQQISHRCSMPILCFSGPYSCSRCKVLSLWETLTYWSYLIILLDWDHTMAISCWTSAVLVLGSSICCLFFFFPLFKLVHSPQNRDSSVVENHMCPTVHNWE